MINTLPGYPIRLPRDQTDVCSSPRLFAAYRGLLRQIAPRHPPWTLSRLTILSGTRSSRSGPFPFPIFYFTLLKNSGQPLLCKSKPAKRALGFRHPMDQRRVELLTPALSERCSNQLSYWSSVWHRAYCGELSLRPLFAHVLGVPTGTPARSLASDFAKARPRDGPMPNCVVCTPQLSAPSLTRL